MARVSIIIPSRNETYEVEPGKTVLQKTVEDIFQKATGEVEVIVAYDGPPYQHLPAHENLITIKATQQGTRTLFNLAASFASGKYLMKLDSHCMLSAGFDEELQTPMEDNWVVAPRMYILDAENWKWQDGRYYDYFYLPCPLTDPRLFRFQAGGHWKARTGDRLQVGPVDENMKLHGSAFFLSRDFFFDCLHGLEFQSPDNFSGEDIEVSLKTWLGPWDGKLMVNKKAWYAHMHKGGQRPRGFHVSSRDTNHAYIRIAHYWMTNQWTKAARPLSWLIERFEPVPTWPTNWKERYEEWMFNRV